MSKTAAYIDATAHDSAGDEFRESASEHVCYLLPEKHWLRRFVTYWYLPILHCILVTAFTFCMIFALNKKTAPPGHRSWHNWRTATLLQSDITTIIAFCLTIVRAFYGAWHTLMAWRCVFIFLEKSGLSLAEVSTMAGGMHLPALKTAFKQKGLDYWYTSWMITAILLIALPAQFANPIASGSVTWIPSYALSMQSLPGSASVAYAGYGWSWYARYDNDMQTVVQNAAGLAALSKHDATVPAQRMVLGFASHPVGSAVENVTVPLFDIQNLSWYTDANYTDIPIGMVSAALSTNNTYLGVTTIDGNPLTRLTLQGTAAILRDTPWQRPNASVLPSPHLVNGTQYAAVYVNRYYNRGNPAENPCSTAPPSIFSPLPVGIHQWNIDWNNNYSDCIVIANVQVVAGVALCEGGQAQSSCLLSNSSSSIVALNSAAYNAIQDPLVTEVLAMMPEVQALKTGVSGLNLFPNGTFSAGIEDYLRQSLVSSYQGAWSALSDYTSDQTSFASTKLWESHEVLQADVAVWRMYLLLSINLLVTLGGLALALIQTQCAGKTIANPVLTTMMLDCSAVLAQDQEGLCNAAALGKGQVDGSIRLRLRVRSTAPGCERQYHHPMLAREKSLCKDSEFDRLIGA